MRKPTRDRHRVSRVLGRQSVLDPQLPRDRAHQCARRAHGADDRDVGHHQQRLARTTEMGQRPPLARGVCRFLRWVQESSLRFDGSAYRTMLRNDAYWFSRLGVYIERADNTARILDVKYHLLLPAHESVGGALDYFQWQRFCARCRRLPPIIGSIERTSNHGCIADLLILREEMPRSLVELLRESGAKSRSSAGGLWPSGQLPSVSRASAHATAIQPH